MEDSSRRSLLNGQSTATPPDNTPPSLTADARAAKRRGRRDGSGDPLLKTVQFVVYMTRDERQRIEARAKARGLGISPYMVCSALGRPMPAVKPPSSPVPAVNQDTYFQLAQIGNNLNQLARWANIGGGEEPGNAEVLETLNELIPIVLRLRREVIGQEANERR